MSKLPSLSCFIVAATDSDKVRGRSCILPKRTAGGTSSRGRNVVTETALGERDACLLLRCPQLTEGHWMETPGIMTRMVRDKPASHQKQ